MAVQPQHRRLPDQANANAQRNALAIDGQGVLAFTKQTLPARHDIDMNTRVYGRLGSAEVDAEYMKVVPNIPMPPPPAHLAMQGQMALEVS
ncbi:MAG: hypothetical protein IH872_03265 [Chloroflexi bacterium]|nr:hypothetical protein [Chloroflexota bacterium]